MIGDPWFYALAVPAVLIAGISKGGLGGGLGILSVPLMSLVIAAPRAAAIMLPILCLMDLFALWVYRGRWDWPNMSILLPAALVGIAVGTATFRLLSSDTIRLLIGLIALGFTLDYWFGRGSERSATGPSILKGGLWGAVAGFTSFVAHAGGPPINVYLLPQRLDKTVFVGTTVLFFIVVNYVKLVPYWWLGQFQPGNLMTSLILCPLAVVGIGMGFWLHRRVSGTLFYRLCYAFLFIAGIKLVYDGAAVFL